MLSAEPVALIRQENYICPFCKLTFVNRWEGQSLVVKHPKAGCALDD